MTATLTGYEALVQPAVDALNAARLNASITEVVLVDDPTPIAAATVWPTLAEARVAFDRGRRLYAFAVFDSTARFDDPPLAVVNVTVEVMRRMPRRVLAGDVRLGLLRQLHDAGHLGRVV